MFLQYIQSHLSELVDISKTPDFDVKKLSTPVATPCIEDVEFFWGVVKSARTQVVESVVASSRAGLVAGNLALDNIQSLAPNLKRFVSFYQEEDFYI